MNGARLIAVGIVTVILSAVLGLGAGIVAIIATQQNAELREDGNVSACINGNVSRLAIREALKDSLLALVPVGSELTVEQQGRIDRYNARVDLALPFRDCTDAGIALFLADPPPDPGAD